MSKVLRINPDDNVVVCLDTIHKGECISLPDGRQIVAKDKIEAGHKMATQLIPEGFNIVKYGHA